MKQTGLIHLYCGDGKGKTTAAFGLALRCAGAGGRVLIYQFFKDGTSSENNSIKSIPGVTVLEAESDIKFYSLMSETEKQELAEKYRAKIAEIEAVLQQAEDDGDGFDMIVLDEVTYAVNYGMIDEECIRKLIKNKSERLEVVFTGRNPADWLVELADYVSEIHKVKHPYDKGVPARLMIEM